jgi:hypothetical protein
VVIDSAPEDAGAPGWGARSDWDGGVTVPNFLMWYGNMLGANVSAVFLDGHADSINQDFAYDPIHASKEGR